MPWKPADRDRETASRKVDLKHIVVVDFHASIHSEHEATQCHAARDPQEDVNRPDATFLSVGEWRYFVLHAILVRYLQNTRSTEEHSTLLHRDWFIRALIHHVLIWRIGCEVRKNFVT